MTKNDDFCQAPTLEDAAQNACDRLGIIWKQTPHDDRWHRLDTDARNGKDDGRIKYFADGQGGIAWNHQTDERCPFFVADQSFGSLSEAEKAGRKRKFDEQRKQTEAELAETQREAAQLANKIWLISSVVEEHHPYFDKKGVKNTPEIKELTIDKVTELLGYTPRIDSKPLSGRILIIPLKDINDEITSIQFIDENGTKYFLPSGKKRGCFFEIPGNYSTIYICEGVATALSISEAFPEQTVIVAFDVGNLLPVAEAIRGKHQNANIVLCCDDDWKRANHSTGKPENIGKIKALEAARAVNGKVAIPVFGSAERPEKFTDFNDLNKLCGIEAVRKCIEEAITPSVDEAQPIDLETEIDKLATLKELDYQRVRKDKAKSFGLTVSALDKARKERQDEIKAQSDENRIVSDIEPWPEPVDGSELLNDISLTLKRYIKFVHQEDADAVALWVLFSHAIEAFSCAPLLAIQSPQKRCGKTRLLELLTVLARRPLPAANITPAAMFRVIEQEKPTLLIDEADTFIKSSDDLRGIINSGHTRTSAFVIRTEEIAGELRPKRFSTFCAKAIAAIGKLSDTNQDRSIVIELRRKFKSEQVKRFRDDSTLANLARKAARWAADNLDTLRDANPSIIPSELNDRAADNWRALFAIADAAGWGERARRTAETISSDNTDEDGADAPLRLLKDCRIIFDQTGRFQISPSDLLAELIDLAEAPWREWRFGKPITLHSIAKKLATFGIKSTAPIRVERNVSRLYLRRDFEDAWSRYLYSEYKNDDTTEKTANEPPNSESVTDRDENVTDCDGETVTENGVGEQGFPEACNACNGCNAFSEGVCEEHINRAADRDQSEKCFTDEERTRHKPMRIKIPRDDDREEVRL